MLASASEDHFIDIAEVETGQCEILLNGNSTEQTLASEEGFQMSFR